MQARMSNLNIKKQVESYYSNKLKTYGASAKGADWNNEESQLERFKQLLKVIPSEAKGFSVLDYGCGYGKLLDVLQHKYSSFKYTGYDISDDMIRKATEVYSRNEYAKWTSGIHSDAKFEYVISSGVFNVKLHNPAEEWQSYVFKELSHLSRIATKGLAINFLTSYSDREYMRNDLYYADPKYVFDYCMSSISRNITLLHDYDLYEFTLLIKS